jgi:hypothetical protein
MLDETLNYAVICQWWTIDNLFQKRTIIKPWEYFDILIVYFEMSSQLSAIGKLL